MYGQQFFFIKSPILATHAKIKNKKGTYYCCKNGIGYIICDKSFKFYEKMHI